MIDPCTGTGNRMICFLAGIGRDRQGLAGEIDGREKPREEKTKKRLFNFTSESLLDECFIVIRHLMRLASFSLITNRE